jgi:hypothetical protein
MRDDFTINLQSGSAEFAARVTPPAPEAIRARGNRRRRRRRALMSAVLAMTIGAGGAGTAYASFDRADVIPAAARPPSAWPSGTAGYGRPEIVAVTTRGALVVLNPLTGVASRILVAGGVLGGTVSVSPDGRSAYFAARHGCAAEIESVPVAGGRPAMITPGAVPAVSPDGTELALVREPGGLLSSGNGNGCQAGTAGSRVTVVIRDLRSGGERVYPASPDAAAAPPVPVSRLSWAPDGTRLLVSVGPSPANEGWALVRIDPATSRYYLPSAGSSGPAVPLTGPDAAKSYYREGVYLPGGDMFVNRVCCAGWPARTTSSLLWEIDPAGHLVRQVAIGFLDRDHTSLGADPAGRWLLYLSGRDLFVSLEGSAPFLLTPGLIAAAWV